MSLVVLKNLLDSFLPCIAMAHIFKSEMISDEGMKNRLEQ